MDMGTKKTKNPRRNDYCKLSTMYLREGLETPFPCIAA